MPFDSADVRAKLEAGRREVAAGLHRLADGIETVPLEDAAETLTWLGDLLARLEREPSRIFDRK